MKNVLKVISVLLFCGAMFVGCGSSNNNNGTTCSQNGMNGTIVNGMCSVSNAAVSGQCTQPGYPYFLGSVPDPNMGGQPVPACCNQPTMNQGVMCVPAMNGYGGGYGGGYGSYGGYGYGGGTCMMPNGQPGYLQNGMCI